MKNEFEIIGYFSEEVILALNLNIAKGAKIFLSPSTLLHIKSEHPEIKGDYKHIIADIINLPSGVSYRTKDNTIGFFKEFENGEKYFLELSVRTSSIGEFFVRTLHFIETGRVEKRINKGKIIGLDKLLIL
ncbi:MAG: hypothetical protein FWD48_12370 [Oscillospiraceae bacterium]|nr:hypothetical protein [Oscillospiraceae bacterium]